MIKVCQDALLSCLVYTHADHFWMPSSNHIPAPTRSNERKDALRDLPITAILAVYLTHVLPTIHIRA
jgi:hypothetical protein